MRQHGDYDLSLLEVQAEECDDCDLQVRSSSHPFSPAPISQAALSALPESEDVGTTGPGDALEDALMLAAISASLADVNVDAQLQISGKDPIREVGPARVPIPEDDIAGSE